MQDATTQYAQNIKPITGRQLKVRLNRLTNSMWTDVRFMFATIVATMLTMLYVVLNFLLIIYEITATLMMILLNILRSNRPGTMTK